MGSIPDQVKRKTIKLIFVPLPLNIQRWGERIITDWLGIRIMSECGNMSIHRVFEREKLLLQDNRSYTVSAGHGLTSFLLDLHVNTFNRNFWKHYNHSLTHSETAWTTFLYTSNQYMLKKKTKQKYTRSWKFIRYILVHVCEFWLGIFRQAHKPDSLVWVKTMDGWTMYILGIICWGFKNFFS